MFERFGGYEVSNVLGRSSENTGKGGWIKPTVFAELWMKVLTTWDARSLIALVRTRCSTGLGSRKSEDSETKVKPKCKSTKGRKKWIQFVVRRIPKDWMKKLKKILVRWMIVANLQPITHQRHKLTYVVSIPHDQETKTRSSRQSVCSISPRNRR